MANFLIIYSICLTLSQKKFLTYSLANKIFWFFYFEFIWNHYIPKTSLEFFYFIIVYKKRSILFNKFQSFFYHFYYENEDQHEKTWLFEADIALTDEPEGTKSETSNVESSLMKRSLRRNQAYLWIDRVVPYEINSDLGKSHIFRTYIAYRKHP